MIEKSASYIVGNLIEEGLTSEKSKDWYTYSYIKIMETVLNVSTILILSLIFGNTIPAIIFDSREDWWVSLR